MAYNLPMQLSLQVDPSSLASVRKQIESSFKGLDIQNFDAKSLAKANSAIQKTSRYLEDGEKKAETFWNTLEGRTRSAVAYTVVSTALLKLTGAVSQATREAIKYETELLKISQVTGDSVKRTRNLQKSLFDISKAYNVNISKVAQLTRTLTQTGLSFRDAAKGAEILARTGLLATFDSLTSTTEGLIAVMQTFNLTVKQSGDVLEKINAISKAFAVESGDIVEAIRRTGGAFSAAGGQVEELIALFTSVRSTSRESAETIATGFRTIFGRLQRPKTIEYFKALGIQLETAEGQFIGPLKAIEAISQGLDKLNISVGSTKFAEVVEQIGGIRQISRVIPLLEQYRKTQDGLKIQNQASVESYKDVEKAQKGLGFQLGQLKQEFTELISQIVNSSSFKVLAQTFIGITRTVLNLSKALTPLLPLITAFATIKIGRGIDKLLGGGFSFKGMKESLGFASGGMVPGSGNGDTVPAMLTPGEFVIRKSAVKAYGADRLAKINKYARGGPVSLDTLQKRQGKTTITESLNDVREPIDNISADLNRKKIKFGDKSYGIDWDKFVYDVDAIYKRQKVKGQPFSAQGKAFEAVIQKIAGGELAPEPDYPVDIVNNGNPIEVKFTKELTDEKDLVSKLYRYKYKTSQLNNLGFTKGYDKDVDIGDLTVYEMGEGEKAEFNKWYGKKVQGGLSPKEKEFGQILLSEDGKNIEAKYAPNEKRTGFVRTKFWKDNLYTIGLSKATKGYGPKLYDVAMEAITAKGGMLTSDRATVSGDARKVWDFYFNNRSDVKKTPLPRDQWTGNYALVDEKLRGPKETWPPTTDPAWALQTGYSKSPSLINDPNIVKRVKGQQSSAAMALNYFSRFANGGSVNTGTDTVPALLTPGEFVINKKSAQSFGYNNLNKINKYAAGGFVGMSGTMGAMAQQTVMAKNPFAGMGGTMGSAARKTTAALHGFSDKLKDASEQIEESAEEIETANKKIPSTIAKYIFYTESLANSLEQFAGFNINRDALEAGKTKAAQFDLIGGIADKVNTENIENFSRQTKSAGQSLAKMADKVGGRWGKVLGTAGKGLEQFGGKLYASAGRLSKFAKGVGIIGRALAMFELAGGFFESIFSKDYGKVRDRAIAAGDVEGAGEAALKAYNQEFLRGLPIIGGFLSGLQDHIPILQFEADARGRLVQATAEAQASLVRFDKEVSRINQDLSDAMIGKDFNKAQSLLQTQAGSIADLNNRGKDLIAKAKEAGNTSTFSRVMSGAATGGITGAGIGAAVAAVPTVGIGSAPAAIIGGAIGAVVGGVSAYVSAIGKTQEEIIAAYQTAGDLFERAGKEQIDRLNFLSSQLTSSIKSVILAGGSLGQALDIFKEQFGQEAFDEIFGGVDIKSQADLEIAAARAEQRVQESRRAIDDMTEALSRMNAELDNAGWWAWITGADQALERDIAETEANRDLETSNNEASLAQRQHIAIMQQAARDADILAKARKRENEALRESLILMKQRIALFDRLNQGSRNMALALEEVQAAMNGGLTRRQVLERSGIGVSANTLSMSGEEVMRNDSAFNEMYEAVARLGNLRVANDLARSKQDFDLLERVQSELSDLDPTQGLGKVIAEAQARARSDDPTASKVEAGETITNAIIDQLDLQDAVTNNPRLRAALDEYGQKLAEGAEAGTALEKIKKEMSEDQIKLIEETQEKYNEYIQMEQELNNLRIEEISRLATLNTKAYNAEKDYFEQRIALTEKVDDLLNPGPVGPGRVAFLQQRADQRRQARMDGLGSARRRAGLPSDTTNRERDFREGVEAVAKLDLEATNASQTLAQLAVDGEALLSTLQDEIKYEQEYLDSLIEVAKAQQEYTQALNDAQGELVRNLVTGTEEEQADLLSTLNAAAFSAMQGSFQGIPADMKKDIFAIFDQFGDVEIPGLGMTGRDAQREITRNELMMNWGLDAATADQLASKAVRDRVPIDERMAEMIKIQEQKILALLERERQLKEYLQRIDQFNNQIFSMAVDRFAQAVDHFLNNILNAPQDDASGQAAVDATEELKNLNERQNAEMAKVDSALNEAKSDRDRAARHLEQREKKTAEAEENLEQQRKNLQTARELDANDGGNRTAGQEERLMKSQARMNRAMENEAAAKENLNRAEQKIQQLESDRETLASRQADERDMLIETRQAEIDVQNATINGVASGGSAQGIARGGVVYASGGMLVNYEPKGTDTVPAMLTPGEFVMRKEAVDRIGADNLDRMNRGGPIYAENGAYLSPLVAASSLTGVSQSSIVGNTVGAMVSGGVKGTPFALAGTLVDTYASDYVPEAIRGDVAKYGGVGDAAMGVAAGQSIPAAYGAYALADFAGNTAEMLEDLQGFRRKLAGVDRRQLNQSYVGNVGENLLNPGRAYYQLGMNIAGLPMDAAKAFMASVDSADADKKLSDIEAGRIQQAGAEAQQRRNNQQLDSYFSGSLVANPFKKATGGIIKYLAEGGPSSGPYRSQANIARFGASDPRFEQYGLRGLDPNSEYYQEALAYWQQVMDFQNRYNQRAAYWNQGIAGQQMQWMQMMQGMWGQSGYFAKGGKVQYLERGGRKNPVNPHTLAPLQEKLDRDSMGSVIGDAAANLSTLVPGVFKTASTPFIVGKEGSDKRKRNQARSDELDELYKHYMMEQFKGIEGTTGIFSTLLGKDLETGKSKWGSYERQEAESKYKILGNAGVVGGKWLDRMLGDRKTNDQLLKEAANSQEFEENQRKDKESRDAAQAKVDKARDPFIESFRKKRKGGGGGKSLSDRLAEMNANIDRMNRERAAKYGELDENGNPIQNPWPAMGDEDYAGSYREKNWKAMEYGTTLDDIGQTNIGGTTSGVGTMKVGDGADIFSLTGMGFEQNDPFAGITSESAMAAEVTAPAAPAATAATATATTAAAAAAETPVEPSGPSFTPTGNIGVDGLMNKPLDITKGNDRGNQARYRSRLDALRRAGADNKALDEFKAQYRGKVYGAENQQVYDYNKARLSGRAAQMINPKDRTSEQQARAEAYKNDILAPNAEARKKSLATGSPMPSIASRAAEYNKRKTGGAASQAAAGASPSTSPQNVSSLGGSVGGTLGGLFGGQTGAVLGSDAGNVLGNLANLPNGNNLQAMTTQMNGGTNQQEQPQLQPNRNAAPNIPAQVASQSRTSNLLGANQNNGSSGTSTGYGGGMGGGGPIQVNTTGTQEIIVRLPDIQALVNQSITSLIYDTIGSTFKNLADKVMTANNFEDVANSLSQGYTDATTKQVSSQGQVGGK